MGVVCALRGMACPWVVDSDGIGGADRPPRGPVGRRTPADPCNRASRRHRHRHPPMRLASHHTLTDRLIPPPPIKPHPPGARRRAGHAGSAPIARRPLGRTRRWFRSSGRRSGRRYDLRPPAPMASADRRHPSSQHDMHTNPEWRCTDNIQRTTTNVTTTAYELDDGTSPGSVVTTTGIEREEKFIAAGSLPSTESTKEDSLGRKGCT